LALKSENLLSTLFQTCAEITETTKRNSEGNKELSWLRSTFPIPKLNKQETQAPFHFQFSIVFQVQSLETRDLNCTSLTLKVSMFFLTLLKLVTRTLREFVWLPFVQFSKTQRASNTLLNGLAQKQVEIQVKCSLNFTRMKTKDLVFSTMKAFSKTLTDPSTPTTHTTSENHPYRPMMQPTVVA
jgi:hypothetical protein